MNKHNTSPTQLYSTTANFLIAGILALVVIFFIFTIKPYKPEGFDYKLLDISSYGIAVGIAYVLSSLLTRKWKQIPFFKYLTFYLFAAFFTFVANQLFFNTEDAFTVQNFWYWIVDSFTIFMLPLILIEMIVSSLVNSLIFKPKNKESVKQSDIVTFLSLDQEEYLVLKPQQILYVTQELDKVVFHYLNPNRVVKNKSFNHELAVILDDNKNVFHQVNEHTLVNLTHFTLRDGDDFLQSEHLSEVIPVENNFRNETKSYFSKIK